MAGRKPKPTALKILQGNPGKRKLNKNEPKPRTEIPSCPTWLTAMAQMEWKRIVPQLKKLGLISKLDRSALAAYCQAFGRWQDAELEIRKYGFVCITDKGNVIQRPEVGIANKALEQMYKFLTEFGMSPASRTKLSVAIKKPEDDMDAFMKRGKKAKGNIVKFTGTEGK